MSSSKKIDLYVQGLCGRCLAVESQNPFYPLPLHTLYSKCILIQYSHREGGGRGELNKSEGERGKQFTKLGRKYQHDGQYLQSINSDKHLSQSPDKHLSQSPLHRSICLDDDILLWCL
jgi:hypothetical protein